MSKDLNDCKFIGRLTKDVEIRAVGDSQVAKFAIAVNNSWKNKDGDKMERATFVELEAWNGTAGFVSQYCKKGDLVFVSAEYSQSSSEKDGERRTFHSFRVTNLQKLSWDKRDEVEDNQPAKAAVKTKAKKTKEVEEEDEDSIPF